MNELQKEFLPYDLSLRLKALGFDEPCIYYVDKNNNSYIYNFQTHPDEFIEWCGVNVIPTPTFSQCFRWFREKYNLFGKFYIINFGADEYSFNIYDLYEEKYKYENFIGAGASYTGTFDTYEEAELACLEKLIEIVESKN